MKSLPLLSLCLLLLLPGCSKKTTTLEEPKNEWVDATIVNKTGLDACSWELQLTNEDYLEPINLNDFGIELKDGKPVSIKYVEAVGMGSFCMIGMVVEIKEMKER